MFNLALAVIALVAASQGVPLNDDTPTCVTANTEIDALLKTSNEAIKKDGKDVAVLDEFESDSYISFLGIKLISVKAHAENGKVSSLDSLVRAGDATTCTTTAGFTTKGDFTYGELKATYDVTFHFLFWNPKGSLSYTIPTSKFNLDAEKSASSCGINDLKFADVDNIQTSLETKSWFGGLLSRLTGGFLLNDKSTQSLSNVQALSKTSVTNYLVTSICTGK